MDVAIFEVISDKGNCVQQLGCHKGRYDSGALILHAVAADWQDQLLKI